MFRFLYNFAAAPLLRVGLRLLALFQDKARRLQEAQAKLFPELATKLQAMPPDQTRILVHVSSVGEYLSALPLIRAIRERNPRLGLALSFTSPSLEGQLSRNPAAHLETYLPLDTSAAVRRFLEMVRPSLILFASYDVWPNLLWLARERGIACALVNGILSETSGRYRFPARYFFAALYRALDWIGAVSADDAERFASLGLGRDRITVTGNCRFDQTLLRCRAVGDDDPDLAVIAPGRWLVAGSTWPEDEAALVPAWLEAAAKAARLGLIIAPHEPTEEHLRPLEAAFAAAGISCARYGHLAAGSPMPRVVLVDRVGILYKLYRRGEAAFVGGGFGRSVHNVMEPAGMGLPVLFGPRHRNAAEAFLLKARGGGFSVAGRAELAAALSRLGEDEKFRQEAGARALAVVEENAGATERTLEKLMKIFPKIFSGGEGRGA